MRTIVTKSIAQLAKEIGQKNISPVEIVKKLLKRIERVDPLLNTYITVDEHRVLAEAKAKEKEIQNGIYKGPLHGVPIGIKDNIFTKQLKTTMGSNIYKDFVPTEDAFVIKTLRKAGAIIIGKHNTHQFAYGPTGDRSHVGPVKNPYDPTKMTGGSSAGSAAAVAACLCYGALGTDTSGSVRIPASFCGVVGMKPTYGSVSNEGVYPLSWILDHIGPITRTVKDNALLLNAIIAYNHHDLCSIERRREDFSRLIGKGIKGKRIGVPRHFYYENDDEEIIGAIEKVIKIMKEEGAIVDEVKLSHMNDILEAQRIIIGSDAYAVHEENLKKYPNLWDDEVRSRLYSSLNTKGYEYAKALRMKKLAIKEFYRAFETFDAIMTPTMSIMPPNIGERYTTCSKSDENHIRWTITRLTAPTNLNGFPSLTIPCGYSSQGMPLGVQFIGKVFAEAMLYQIGYVLEENLALKIAKVDI